MCAIVISLLLWFLSKILTACSSRLLPVSIRGIVGESLIPESIIKYASAYAAYCSRGHIIVGRDGRVTGSAIKDMIVSTVRQMGSRVTDLGICPTPTVALAVEKMRAAGGISITASHNPMV